MKKKSEREKIFGQVCCKKYSTVRFWNISAAPKKSAGGFPEIRLAATGGDEGFSDYFPFVSCEAFEVPMCGENLG